MLSPRAIDYEEVAAEQLTDATLPALFQEGCSLYTYSVSPSHDTLPSGCKDLNDMTSCHDYVIELHERLTLIQTRPTRPSQNRPGFVLKELQHCTNVLAHVDATKTQLRLPYEGPYPVKSRTNKNVTIDSGTTASIDQVKLAHMKATVNTYADMFTHTVAPLEGEYCSDLRTDAVWSHVPTWAVLQCETARFKHHQHRT